VSIKDRIKRLEKRAGKRGPVYPYVVRKREDESIEEAAVRTAGSLPVRPSWTFIVAPVRLSEVDWVAKYSPGVRD